MKLITPLLIAALASLEFVSATESEICADSETIAVD